MLKTNTNKYNEKIYKYILDCIDSEYGILVTPEEKINHFFDRFEIEYNYKNNILRYPNLQNRIAEYLMGLPFNFEYENYKILQLTESLHECKLTDKQEDKFLSNYWNHLAFKILQLNDKIETNNFK